MLKLIVLVLLLAALLNPLTLAWIAGQYVASDPLEPSDAIVALRGDPIEDVARTDEALRLLQKHYAPVILLDVSSVPYFGAAEAQLASQYLQRKGVAVAQMQFCENDADSTAEEAIALRACFERIGARRIIVVTSEYHTRRARDILRHTLQGSGISVLMHPAYNPEYWDPHWWRKRRWAKTFFFETAKIIWTEGGFAFSRLAGKASPEKPQSRAVRNRRLLLRNRAPGRFCGRILIPPPSPS